MRIHRMFIVVVFLNSIRTVLFGIPSTYGQELYEAYYQYLGNRPDEKQPGWHVNAQGVTHDLTHWYITYITVETAIPFFQESRIMKIPVEHDLEFDVENPTSTTSLTFAMPFLRQQGYDHFGDLTYYRNQIVEDEGYLVIPITGKNEADEDLIPVIAVLRASDLSYVGHDTVKCGEMGTGWVAVDPRGLVYTSGSGTTNYSKYELSWDLVPQNIVVINSDCDAPIPFLDMQGEELRFHHMQGGVFTESGRHLYIVSGIHNEHFPFDGICVFDTLTNRLVQRSTNGYGLFNYEFHTDIRAQEPEGITIWDLDQKGPDTIQGQLHVIMLDNEWPGEDDVFMKHYTNKIYVDGSVSGSGNGTISDPYQTVTQANNYAWNGSEIYIKGGNYLETMTISKYVRVILNGVTPPVLIGQ